MPHKRQSPTRWNLGQPEVSSLHLSPPFLEVITKVSRVGMLAGRIHDFAIEEPYAKPDQARWAIDLIHKLFDSLPDAKIAMFRTERDLMLAFESLKDVYLPTYAGAPGSAHAAVYALAESVFYDACGLRADETELDPSSQWSAIAGRLAKLPDVDGRTLMDLMKREALKASTEHGEATPDEGAPPPAKEIRWILDALNNAKELLTQEMIEDRISRTGNSLSVRTISTLMPKLVKDGLVNQPSGTRKGYAITECGKLIAR